MVTRDEALQAAAEILVDELIRIEIDRQLGADLELAAMAAAS